VFYVRADGNPKIGTGHIMRCLSIAQAVRQQGGCCTFIVADCEMTQLLEQQNFPYICLHSAWNDLNQETAQMEQLIRQESIQTLLIDSYFVTPNYLCRLHGLTHVVYIDDLNEFVYPCSTLVNYSVYAAQQDYSSRYPNTECLLGPQYVPLRSEFQDLPGRQLRREVRDVLVTTGGGDPLNIAGRFAESAVQMFPGVRLHIVAGRFNQYRTQLEHLARKYLGIQIHYNVEHMSELMLSCDAAVSAGGSTLYELCACGVPAVMYALADNQLSGTEAFERSGMMLYAGDVRDNEFFVEALCGKLAVLIRGYPLRRHMSEQMQQAVDGNGARRLADRFRDCSIAETKEAKER